MSRTQSPKQALFEQLAILARALGSGARLELLDFLAQGERSVESLAVVAGLSVANTSKHLQQLRAAGLTAARREGKQVFYSLADGRLLDVLAGLRALAESHLAQVEALIASYLHSRDDFEPLPALELLDRVRDGLVTLVDVRPPEEYAQGHIAGALNLPLDSLEERLRELPPEREVVAYCRGPWCVLAFDAVARLRAKGYRARRLDRGYPEWRQAENLGKT